ncbi:hypothetical protein LWI28_028419 [Acer negundo]|uniref:Uncharacterized protein n=1 Tax=Acer negundo TaxID=4023 RepID=A0AAD5NT99_ACENE|nr:hypothetical protein LWI28_028419 [Acer negundo]
MLSLLHADAAVKDNMANKGTVSEAYQRALQFERTITRWRGGGLRLGTSSSSATSRATVFSNDVVPRPVANPKQQPRSSSELRYFSFGDVEHRQSECKKVGKRVLFTKPEDSQEELVGNIGAEPQFDEDEELQEELVDNIEVEPQFDEDEVVNEDGVEGDVGLLLMVRPASITIIDDIKPEIDEKECYFAPKFDKEVVLRRGDTTEEQGTTMVERLVCLTPRAAFATITNVDEQVEVPTELPFAEEEAQNNKGVVVEQETAMVMRHGCLTPCADGSDWLRNNVFHSTCTILGRVC